MVLVLCLTSEYQEAMWIFLKGITEGASGSTYSVAQGPPPQSALFGIMDVADYVIPKQQLAHH